MSMRTVADPLAKDAVAHLRGTLAGGFIDTIQQVVKDGDTLCRPDLWDGPRALEFRGSWPGLRSALLNAHTDLTDLAGAIDTITTAIMQAGGVTAERAEAAAALRTAAALVRADAEERAGLAARARVDWVGPHRDTFDEDLSAHEGRGAVLADRAARLAARLDDGTDRELIGR